MRKEFEKKAWKERKLTQRRMGVYSYKLLFDLCTNARDECRIPSDHDLTAWIGSQGPEKRMK